MTVIEIIKKSAEFLSKKGVESPRLDSELITSQALGIPRLQLYLNFDKTVPPEKAELIKEMVIQRGKRIPLQHILGNVVFCGVNLKIDKRALIPRSETEILTETAIELLKDTESPLILDFGTGSGCIAIAMAKKIPSAKIVALDISSEALELAKENSSLNNVMDRVYFCQSDGFSIFEKSKFSDLNEFLSPDLDSKRHSDDSGSILFDAIVSNPPYIPESEIPNLQPEVKEYDPIIALNGGADGLDIIRVLAREGGKYLKPAGFMAIEIGAGQSSQVSRIMEGQGWQIKSVLKDYNKIERVIVASR